ncbi:uncharacterized protein LOC116273681 [Papio anubis]|uniref:uncharacterized protein LOC116273681 n=1 Tax=Papio anubis TaxID=9555 RepID=UPI0012ADE421|nr:uncharacterized protein LOC116273681 [Papio anubis]
MYDNVSWCCRTSERRDQGTGAAEKGLAFGVTGIRAAAGTRSLHCGAQSGSGCRGWRGGGTSPEGGGSASPAAAAAGGATAGWRGGLSEPGRDHCRQGPRPCGDSEPLQPESLAGGRQVPGPRATRDAEAALTTRIPWAPRNPRRTRRSFFPPLTPPLQPAPRSDEAPGRERPRPLRRPLHPAPAVPRRARGLGGWNSGPLNLRPPGASSISTCAASDSWRPRGAPGGRQVRGWQRGWERAVEQL